MSNVILMSFIAGVLGTVLGSACMLIFNLKNEKFVAIMECLSSGFILALICFDMIPESLEMANIFIVIVGVLSGLLFIVLLEKLMPHHQHNPIETDEEHYREVGMLFILVLSVHNLPEGMALGAMSLVDKDLAFAILICLHNIPEGMAICIMLRSGGFSRAKSLGLCAVAGFPTVIGAIIGYLVSSAFPTFMGVCMALAAGAMLYLIFQDIMEDVFKKLKGAWISLATVGGLLIGLLVIKVL